MELRVPGIGGPSPESVLGVDRDAVVTTWRSEPGARSTVRHAAGDFATHVYDWRPLTSGSRSFGVWPLLLPFTLVNIAGWMGPPVSSWRGRVHRYVVVVLGLAMTASCAVWLTIAGLGVWVSVLHRKERSAWPFWLAMASAAVGLAILVLGATFMASGYDRFRPASWDARPARPWRGLWGPGMYAELDDVQFYDNGREHEVHWRVHVIVAVLALVGTVVSVVLADGTDAPQRGVGWLVVGTGLVQAAAVAALLALALGRERPRRRPWSRFLGATTGAMAVMLLGGLTLSGLLLFNGLSSVPTGSASMLYDVYGWSVLAGITVAVGAVVYRLLSATAAERTPAKRRLLTSTMARPRARLALAVGDFDAVVVAVGGTFLIGGGIAFVLRRFVYDDDEAWTLTSTPPVQLARLTFAFVIAALVINVVKSRANPAALRRVGNIWDIITFWPRSFHPFAVRPYAERAVPELREFVLHGPRNSPLVIAAHSQGSVLTYAALRPLHRDEAGPAVLRLVTFGSPLWSLYAKAFPAYFTVEDFTGVRVALNGEWWNVFRCTDHVGRALFVTDDQAVGDYCTWREGALPTADTAVPDPGADGLIEGHNNYWPITQVRAAILGGQQPSQPDQNPQRGAR